MSVGVLFSGYYTQGFREQVAASPLDRTGCRAVVVPHVLCLLGHVLSPCVKCAVSCCLCYAVRVSCPLPPPPHTHPLPPLSHTLSHTQGGEYSAELAAAARDVFGVADHWSVAGERGYALAGLIGVCAV